MALTNNKRNGKQKAADAVLLQTWLVKGWTLAMMAEALEKLRPYTLSKVQISYDIKKLEAEWRAQNEQSRTRSKERLLAEIDMVRREAWSMLEASQKKTVKVKKESEPVATPENKMLAALFPTRHQYEKKDKEKLVAMVRETQTTHGDPSLLRVILECNRREAELMGLDAPKQTLTDITMSSTQPQTVLYLPEKEPVEPMTHQKQIIDAEEVQRPAA